MFTEARVGRGLMDCTCSDAGQWGNAHREPAQSHRISAMRGLTLPIDGLREGVECRIIKRAFES